MGRAPAKPIKVRRSREGGEVDESGVCLERRLWELAKR